jgi:glycosyltransferase involved in cell wall biosynthesis
MMHVLLVTDAFPPICGGSGWSTYELARGLRRLGHQVSIVRPRPGQPAGVTETQYEDFTIHEVGAYAPPVPYVRNYFKNERLTRQLTGMLARFARERGVDLIHGQHLLSTPAALAAARIVGVPGVATVRDYWPVCYWSDLIHDYQAPTLCPACSAGMMTRCIRPRGGAIWPVALPLIPYMRANLRRKREALSRADAVIAVSSTIGRDLAARAPELARTRIEIIPNPVDVRAIRAAAQAQLSDTAPRSSDAGRDVASVPGGSGAQAGSPPFPVSPYAIYVGKLAPNKGTGKLMTALARARLSWPLVIVGDGPDRAAVEAQARASGRDVRFTGWLSRAEALQWLGRASLLVFPSHGPESLSRVLLEASALGVPTAAMDTGGTRDIIQHEQTGLLSTSPEELGDHVARLVQDAALRARLGDAARAWVDGHFDAPAVVSRIVSLYEELRAGSTPARAPANSDAGAQAEAEAHAAADADADTPGGTSRHA